MPSILLLAIFLYEIATKDENLQSEGVDSELTYNLAFRPLTCDSQQEQFCATSTNINQTLSNIPSNYSNLLINLYSNYLTIDLSKLSHKMSVQFITEGQGYCFSIQGGDIREYVSELTIKDLYRCGVTILNDTLTVEKLNLISTNIVKSDYNINFTYLNSDEISLYSIISASSNIYAKQISLILNKYSPKKYHQISFSNSKWKVYENNNYSPVVSVPYQRSEKFGIIGITNKYYLNIEQNTTTTKPINITLLKYNPISNSYSSAQLLDENYKFPFEIITNGTNWDKIKDKTDVYFTSYEDYVNLITNRCNSSYVNLIQKPIEYPSIPLNRPYPSPSQSPTASQSPAPTSTPLPPCIITFSNDTVFINISQTAGTISSPIFIDEELESISSDIDNLIIYLQVNYVQIDFTKLTHKMAVQIISNSTNNILYLTGGYIQNYVSKLTINNLSKSGITIKDKNFIIEELNLINSIVNNGDYTFIFNYLAADFVSMKSIIWTFNSNLSAKQITYILRKYTVRSNYQVTFDNNNWIITDYMNVSSRILIPYKYSEKLGLIGISSKFYFKCDGLKINTTKPVNVTLFDYNSVLNQYSSANLLEDSNFVVRFVTIGDWRNMDEMTDIYFTSYESYVDLDLNECDQSYVNIIKKSIEPPSIPFDDPYPVAVPTYTPDRTPFETRTPTPSATPTENLTFIDTTVYFNVTETYYFRKLFESMPTRFDKLIVYVKSRLIEVDFTYLTHKMSIKIISENPNLCIRIEGKNVRNYVSELTIMNIDNNGIEIYNTLIIDKINIIRCYIKNGYMVVKDLTTDYFSIKSILKSLISKKKIEQISLLLKSYSPTLEYRVLFNNTGWTIYRSDKEKSEFYLPYKYASRLGLIGLSNKYDLHVESEYVSKIKPINILLHNYSLQPNLYPSVNILENKDLFSLKIVTSGNWSRIYEATDIYFTSFGEHTKLDLSECDLKLVNIIEREVEYSNIIMDDLYPTQIKPYIMTYSNDTAYLDINLSPDEYSFDTQFLNQAFASIPMIIKNLIINVNTKNIEIDFTKLSHKMSVQIISNNVYNTLNLLGDDIRQYVSELTINNFTGKGINIKNNVLYVDNLNLLKSKINTMYQLNFIYLAADTISLKNVIRTFSKNVHAKQISLILDNYPPEDNYRIHFIDSKWSVYYQGAPYSLFNIDYKYSEKLGLIGISNNFNFTLKSSTVQTKPVNITLIDYYSLLNPNSHANLLEADKFYVQITTSGSDWDSLENKAYIYITSYEDYIDLDTSQCHEQNVAIVQSKIEFPLIPFGNPYPTVARTWFPSQSNYPTPTPLPSRTLEPYPSPSNYMTYSDNVAYFTIFSTCSVSSSSCFINRALAAVPLNIEYLIIYLNTDYIEIDFSKLSHKVSVRVIANSKREFYIEGGDIRDYVSELMIKGYYKIDLTVQNSVLVIDRLDLIKTQINRNSKEINFSYIAADSDSLRSVYDTFRLKNKEQISLIIDKYSPRVQFQIEINSNRWIVYNSSCVGCPMNTIFFSTTKMFGIIGVSYMYHFDVTSEKPINNSRPINLTLVDFDSIFNSYSSAQLLEDDYKFSVKIIAGGYNWQVIDGKQDIYVTSYEKYMKINYDDIDLSYVNIIQQSIKYPYLPPNNPYPSPSPSKSPTASRSPSTTPSPSQTKRPLYTLTYSNDTAYLNTYSKSNTYHNSPLFVNKALESIPSNINNLIIIPHASYVELNFSKLTHKMKVEFQSSNLEHEIYITGGNISDYVSEITCRNFHGGIGGIRIKDGNYESILILDKLTLLNTRIKSGSVRFNYLTIDSESSRYINGALQSDTKSEQVSFILDDYTPTNYYKIRFDATKWIIINGSSKSQLRFSYAYTSRLCLIGISNKFEFNGYTNSLIQPKPINITLLDYDTHKNSAVNLLDEYKFPVDIITSGDNWNINGTVDVYFTSFENHIKLNTSRCNQSYINFISQSFGHPPIQDNPYPIPSQSPTQSATSSPTFSPSESPTETPSKSPTPSQSPKKTPHPTYSLTKTPNPTRTPMATLIATETPSQSPNPTETPTASVSRSPTETPDPTPEPTNTPTASVSRSPTETPEPTETPIASESRSPTETPGPTVTEIPSESAAPLLTQYPTQSPEPIIQSPAASASLLPVPCNINNCLQCDLPNICSMCDEGYDLVDEKCILHATRTDLCLSNILGCLTCQKGENNKCSICNVTSHWELHGDLCTCENGYDLIENNCVLYADRTDLCYVNIPHCSLCKPGSQNECQICNSSYITGNKCDSCIEGYYLSSNLNGYPICSPCRIGCINCVNYDQCNSNCRKGYLGTNCTNCENNYYQQIAQSGEVTCLACPENCETCQNKLTCNTCKEGFIGSTCNSCEQGYWPEYSNDRLVSCTSCGANCNVCSSISQCRICKEGYAGSNCQNCDLGYVKENDICVPKQATCEDYKIYNCDKCLLDGNKPFCYSCHTGYDGDTCDHCSEEYFSSGSGSSLVCTHCAKNCVKCASETQCAICREGFSEESNCNECIEGYYYDNTNESCIYCGNGCSKCINSNQCIECLPGFDIKSNCKICESNFFATINESTKHLTCTYCGDGCASCSSTSKCDACKEGYSQSTNCNQCIDGYYKKNYLSGSFECISCGRGCATCKTSRTCDTYKDNFINEQDCEVGYFVHDFNNGTIICDKCSENCESCSSIESCITCKEGYSNPENLCKDCINGYYKDTSTENPRCLSCPTNCLLCTSAKQCTQCKIGYSNSESNSICNACDTSGGYIVVSTNGSTPVCGHECENDNDCSENAVCNSNSCVCKLGYIGENCLQCATGFTRSSFSQCDTCDTGFYKQEDGNCSPCSSNCVNCSSNSICNSCEQGYILTAELICIKQNAIVTVYEEPDLKYLDENIVNSQCLNENGKFTFDEKVVESLPSDGNQVNEVLRVDLEKSVSSIELNSSSVGVFLDLTDATIEQSIDLKVSDSQQQSYLKFNDNSEVILNIDNDNSKNINIIGGKKVLFNTSNRNQSTIKVGTISPIKNSNDPFVIGSNVPVVVDSIDLYGSLSVKASENTKVVANNVVVKQAATVKIDNIHINNVLEIGESSQIKFENNSTFEENAKIIVKYKSTYKTEFASIVGKLPEKPPQVFNMISNKNANSLDNLPKFLLAQSENSEFQCSEWQKKCSSSIGQSSEFNDCKCLSNKNLQADESSLLYAVITKEKSSLSGGAIAGIVIACIAIVAIIVIVLVYFFVIKKKNQENLSEMEDDQKQEDASADDL